MHLTILSPNKRIFEGEVLTVKLPGDSGNFQVLNNHAPIISTLTSGIISYNSNSTINTLKIDSGVVEVLKNNIVILINKE